MELNNFKFNKKFGQNFIFDNNLLCAIVSDSEIKKQDEVLEIGPGAGTLTKIIAQNCRKLVSYEIDENLKDILKENLKGVNNVNVIFKDALKTDLSEIENNFTGNYSIIANLPYYITTPLIFKFIYSDKVDSITIMIQKEVAERLVAKKDSKDYGIITVILDFFGNVKKTRDVNRQMFTPVPNVDSCVVRIEKVKNKYSCNCENFVKVVRGAFSMRRKTLVNNLSSSLNLTKTMCNEILTKCGFKLDARAEQLSTQDFVLLTNAIFDDNRQN